MQTERKKQGAGYRKGNKVTVSPWKHSFYSYRAMWIENGKPDDKGFKKKKDAEAWAKDKESELLAQGTESTVTHSERSAVIESRNRIESLSVDLRAIIEAGIEHHENTKKSCTVAQAVKRTLSIAEEEGKSANHIQGLTTHLTRFEDDFGNRMVSTITKQEVIDWLNGLGTSSKTTKKNYNASLRALYNQAIDDKYATSSPCRKPKVFKEAVKDAEIITPDELASLLNSADEEILPSIALAAFAGIRTEELTGNKDHRGLRWSDIKLEKKTIWVPAEVSKKDKKRKIPISENLYSWLLPYAKRQGRIWPTNGRRRFDRAKKLAGFGTPGTETEKQKKDGIKFLRKWPSNALRHSFSSYHLAKFENAAQLSLYMGNTPSMIFDYYDGAADEADANTYWLIMPERAKNIVSMKGAA